MPGEKEKWPIPLSPEAVAELKPKLVREGAVPVSFLDRDGSTVNLITGERTGRSVNVMYKPIYWAFTEETIQLIEKRTGLKGVRRG